MRDARQVGLHLSREEALSAFPNSLGDLQAVHGPCLNVCVEQA